MKRLQQFLAIIILVAILLTALPVTPAHAAGVVSVCDEAHLRTALTGGGIVTFSCSGTIRLASTITIAAGTTLDGTGQSVTISGDTNNDGNGDVRVFDVNGGIAFNLNQLTVTKGYGDYGGGIHNNGGTLNVTNSTFSDNYATAGTGGGIYSASGTVNVTNSTFSGNEADAGGGGIYSASGTVNVTNSTFSGNEAFDNNGGGVYNAAGRVNVTNSTFSGNRAGNGGGVYNAPGIANVTNSTFAGNDALWFGGGIANRGALNVTNSTFSDNYATAGRGIYNNNTVTVKNSIVVKDGGGDNCSGTIGGSNNLADDWSCGSGFTNSSSILLGALGNYGGGTQTIPLLPGSAAIDAGNDATCAASVGDPNYGAGGFDQRGIARAGQGAHCDIGAFESRGFAFSNLTGTPQSTNIRTAFANPLALNVTANSAGEPVNGGAVTFTAPSSGASTNPTTNTTTIVSGAVSQSVTANGTVGGTYNVVASAAGATNVNFSLTNTCLATVIVTSANDSGAGSLRQAIVDVCANGTITFNGDYTISLASQLTIDKNLTIDGAGHSVTVSGYNVTRVFQVNSGITFDLNHLTVANGYSFANGGGIYNNGGTLNVTNSTFSGNYARESGGGIYNNGGTLNVTNSTFSGNLALGDGAGIGNNGGTLNVTNSTFSGNRADWYGGGIYGGGTLNVTNSTFAVNSADFGGGIYSGGSVTIRNSIIANSTSGGNCLGAIGGSNNLANDASCGSSFTNSSSILLSALGNFGGSTQTFALLPGSAAIDATSSNCPSADQRGVTRSSPACDIGAVESRGFTLTKSGGDNQSTPINTVFANPLNVTLNETGGSVLAGGSITFNAPSSGASTTFAPTIMGTTNPSGIVSLPVTANSIAGGPYNVIASAAGATGVNFALTNSKLNTTTTLTSAPNPSFYGQSVTLTATVAPSAATGTVTFKDNGADIAGCVNVSLNAGQATCATSALALGAHANLTAEYSGDASYNASTSSNYSHTVNCASALTVTNANDSGAGSLRQAIAFTCAGGTITFNGDYTIHLASTLTIDKNLTIDGVGHSVTVSGDANDDGTGDVRVFYVYEFVTFNLNQLTVTKGNAGGNYGGGIYGGGTLNVTNSTFSGNSASEGGGIYGDNGTLIVTNSTFSANIATNLGGGGISSNCGTLNVTNSTFASNSANYGGGIFGCGTLNVTNSTFASNSATMGGGVFNLVGTLNVTNSTFSGNIASDGGGIYSSDGSVYMTNNIIANSPSGGNCNGAIGGTNNLADDGSCGSGFTNSSSILLGALGNYGGTTQTFPLLPGSAAIEAGNDATCTAVVGAPNYGAGGLDQRGVTRPQGAHCDIGAFESRGFTLTKTGDNQSANINTAFTNPLALNVTSAFGEPRDGGQVTFTAPSSGASITVPSFTLTIASGAVSQSVTANGTVGGPYNVTASARGASDVNFSLTNNPVCSGAITVTNANDSGAGSLRQAIAFTCAGGTINFDSDYTIPLASELAIGKSLTIDGAGHNVTVSGNHVTRVFNLTGGTITLNQLTIADGYFDDGYSGISGAGIRSSGSTLYLTNSTVSGNTTGWPGGGGMELSSGTANVINSTFIGNSGVYGGGIDTSNSTTLNVTNSTFWNNSATQTGGAISVGGIGNIVNSTISGNSAIWPSGGGINNEAGSVTVTNSIIANNSHDNCFNHYPEYSFVGVNSLVDDSSCSIDNIAGFTNSASILLGTLGNYGGTTQTFALVPGSAAIDAGDNSTCSAPPVNNLDQRGISRTQGTACDIGAFESRGFTFINQTGTPQSTNINTAFANPLGLTVSANDAGEPVSGGKVTFIAPPTDASTNPATNIATIAAGGAVSQNVSANGTTGGPYNVVASAAGAADVNFALTNNKADTTTTLASSTNPSTYGQSVTFSAQVSPTPTGGTVAFKDNSADIAGCTAQPVNGSGQATCTTAALTAGPHTITAEYSGDADFNPSAGTLAPDQQVNQALLTITADNTTKVYGEPLPAFTVTYGGFVGGESESVLGGTLAFDTAATQTSPVGPYTVTPQGLTSTNYNITFVDGTLTITQADATVTLSDLSHEYDGTPKSATATTNPAGLTVTFTYDGNPAPPTNVGTYTVEGTIVDTNYQGSASDDFIIQDTTAPTVAILSINPNPTNAGTTVTWSANENGTYSVRVGGIDCTDGMEVATGANSTLTINTDIAEVDLIPGSNTLRVCVTDAASNTGSDAGSVTQDITGPLVTIDSVSPDPTNAGTTVTWHAAEDGAYSVRVGGTDCTTGTEVATGAYTAPATIDTNIAGGDLVEGTNTIWVCVADAASNTDSASSSVTRDSTAPNLTSFTRQTPATSPTNADTLTFRATFSKDVQNVNAGDFFVNSASTAGITTVDLVTNSSYDITVSGGDLDTFNGEVGLDVMPALDGLDITDLAGNALPEGEPGTDETYLVDNTSSEVTSILRQDPLISPTNATTVTFRVTFGDDVQNVDTADFTLVTTATAAGTINSIIVQSGSVYDVVITGVGGNGTLGLGFAPANDIQDLTGNALGTSPTIGMNETYLIDNTSINTALNGGIVGEPGTLEIINGRSYTAHFTTIKVTFNEDASNPAGNIDPDDVTNPANYLLLQTGPDGVYNTTQCSALSPLDIQIPSGPVTYDNNGGAGPFVAMVTVNNGTPLPSGEYRLYLCGTTSIVDLAGLPLGGGMDTIVNFGVADPVSPAPSTTSTTSATSARRLPATGFAPNRVTLLPPQTVSYTDLGDLWLEIPKLGVKMSIVGIPQKDNEWNVSWLGSQAGWLEGSAYPSWAGNSVLTSHVWNADNSAGPFRFLNTLWWGDKVIVHLSGQQYIYEIRSVKQVSPTNVNAMLKHEDLPWLTLVTCKDYDEETGEYRYRILVRAVLVEVK